MSPSLIHRAACVALALTVVLPGAMSGAAEASSTPAELVHSIPRNSFGPQIAPVEFDFELFETAPFHHQNKPLRRAQWVRAAVRLNKGLTRPEARRIWRRPKLRPYVPIVLHNSQRGVRWVSPALDGTVEAAVGGCKVSTSVWSYGYMVTAFPPFFLRDPLFRFTLHKEWRYDGWRVIPTSSWHDHHITPFADLRWNYEGIIEQQDRYVRVGSSSKATHLTQRIARFKTIDVLGGAIDDRTRHILAKWHGGWETPGHSAHFCTDD